MHCTRLTTRDRSSTLGRRVAHKDLLVIGIDARILDVTNTVVVPVLPVPLERVHAAEVLVAAADHAAAVEDPRAAHAGRDAVRGGGLGGHAAADPLRARGVAEVRADVPLHVRRAPVRLHVLAVRAAVRVRARLGPQ